jgi:hypothetical protein
MIIQNCGAFRLTKRQNIAGQERFAFVSWHSFLKVARDRRFEPQKKGVFYRSLCIKVNIEILKMSGRLLLLGAQT